jgi:glycosyltransferase involved in cell wall biosynthesis
LSIGKLNHQFWAAFGADTKRIFFVPLGVDTDYFREKVDLWRARRAEIRAENGWTQDYVLLYVGRLVRQKRVDVLIEAMQKLELARKDIGLLIVGDGVEYEPLADQASSLQNVHFLGFRDLPDLPQYYAIADAFVLPSEIEPWGIVVAEALACGLPVIATRKVGAAWDLVQDGKNGYVVPENDAAALAVAIDRACQSNSFALGDRESQGAVANWGMDSYVRGIHAALDYCLPDSG